MLSSLACMQDIKECVRAVASFLDIPASEEVLDAAVGKSQFKQMQAMEKTGLVMQDAKKNPSLKVREGEEPFIRKGVVGDWKNYFSEEQSKQVDDAVKKLISDCPGLELTFE